MSKASFPDFTEMVYDAHDDVLHMWIKWDRPHYNDHIRDGIYRVLDLETDELVGFEIVNFGHVAEKNPEVRDIYAAIRAMTADRITYTNPQPTHALRELVGV